MNTHKSLFKWMLIPMVFMQFRIFRDYWGNFCIKSIIHRKQMANNIWWLTSTLFIIIMPALGKGIQGVQIALMQEQCSNVNLMISLYVSKGLKLTMLFLELIWKSEAVQELLQSIIKG